jgi:hypothetical protein
MLKSEDTAQSVVAKLLILLGRRLLWLHPLHGWGIINMSAYERSGVSRGADPASNGTHQSVGIFKRSEQIVPKAPYKGLSVFMYELAADLACCAG